jgi:hypothetical protein
MRLPSITHRQRRKNHRRYVRFSSNPRWLIMQLPSRRKIVPGKMLPEVAAANRAHLSQLRRDERRFPGLLAGVQISPPSPNEKGCPVVEAGVAECIYPLNRVPRLPRPGCKRAPCCACIFVPVTK